MNSAAGESGGLVGESTAGVAEELKEAHSSSVVPSSSSSEPIQKATSKNKMPTITKAKPGGVVAQFEGLATDSSTSLKQQLGQEGWSFVDAQGEWTERSAGGSWQYPTWIENDQFQLKVLRPCNLVLVLTQISIDHDQHQPVGFYVTSGHLLLRKVESNDVELVAQAQFVAAEEVWCSLSVAETSIFNIIPCTLHPGVKMGYFLTAFYDIPDPDGLLVKLHSINDETVLPALPQSPQRPASRTGSIIRSGSKISSPLAGRPIVHSTSSSNVLDETDVSRASENKRLTETVRQEYRLTTYRTLRGQKQAVLQAGVVWSANEGGNWDPLRLIRTSSSADGEVSGMPFKELLFDGAWSTSTAGGSIGFPSFRDNPCYFLSSNINTRVVLHLKSQSEVENELVTNINSVGLYVAMTDGEGRRPLQLTKKNTIGSLLAQNAMEASLEIDLDANSGPYAVIPCTRYPSAIMPFQLSVFVEACDASQVSLCVPQWDWEKSFCKGCWKGVTAGGSQHYTTYRNNPVVFMKLAEPSIVNIFLSQLGEEVHAVGFYILRGRGLDGELLSESEFVRTQEVYNQLVLEGGDYTILPSCLEAGLEGSFTITVYAEHAVQLELPEKKRKAHIASTIENAEDQVTKAARIADEKRSRIVREIFETEKSYVEGLQTLQSAYIEPFTTFIVEKEITEEQFQRVFSTIAPILEFNRMFLKEIEGRAKTWGPASTIGEVFLEHCLQMRMYANHCNNYNKALETLASLQKNKLIATFVENCLKEGRLTIESYLIMPIQRIPRYVMLLQELVKHTPDAHPDYADVSVAAGKLQEIAAYLNEKKREADNLEKLQAVTAKIPFLPESFVSATRRYIREGPIYFVQTKGKKERGLAILCSDMLLYINQKRTIDERIVLDDGIDLDSSSDGTTGFSLVSRATAKRWTWIATMPEEKLGWIVDIKSCLLNNSKL